MLDEQTQSLLLKVLHRTARSLLNYVHDSFPWVTPEEEGALVGLRKIIAAERRATTAIADFLQRHRVSIPPMDAYPASFTSINFVGLDHLLPLLASEEDRAVRELEADLSRIKDHEARKLVQDLIEVKRRHRQQLSSRAA